MDISQNIEPISDMRFDFVSAFDVLFHIVHDKEFENSIRNIYSLLKPRGLFLWSDNFLHGRTLRSEHQVSRSLACIEAILQDTGFQIVQRRPMFYIMNAPVDKPNTVIKFLWWIISSSVSRSEFIGAYIGGLLYPIELLLITISRESPTTEFMICKRV
jgi:SAM-dependent methyltransferase